MTHAGTVFKRHVDALPHQLDDGMAAASQLVEPETGTVALAFRQWLMPDLIRTCRAAHPGARFQLTQVRDELQSATLDGGRAGLEIGTRPAARPG
jgi:LysR family transcriptional regulator, transcription activator of glutamate synthase operon